MKILIIGSGAREHALCRKISESVLVKKIYCAPGNAGTAQSADNIDLSPEDLNGLLEFSKKEKIDLVCVGPEVPLVSGIVDLFASHGIKIFGPSKKAALLEGSKVFAKEVMKKNNVPTADYKAFEDMQEAVSYINTKNKPLVLKADGLAAGKGVMVCSTAEEARDAAKQILTDKIFKEAGRKIVVEDLLEGQEVSILAISDGEHSLIMETSQDHKRAYDNDRGPNTGGMGAYSPAPIADGPLIDEIKHDIIDPVIQGMKDDGNPFKGILYAGIMLTEDGPKVLEFNVRFGDPEAQVILPRMKSDLVELMTASVNGDLSGRRIEWDSRSCVSVVLASGGYPGQYEKGKIIKGLDKLAELKDIIVFHAGTKLRGDDVITSGGRVLNIAGFGGDIRSAVTTVYQAVDKISFEGMFYRKDIGSKALNRDTRDI